MLVSPVTTLSTYFGGSGNEYVNDVAVDSRGNTYVIGTTSSANLPGLITSGGAAEVDRAFLTKFNSEGAIEATKILGPTPRFDAGGYANSYGFAVEVGADDRLFVVYQSFETGVISLQDGGLLPVGGAPQLQLEELTDDLINVNTAALRVIDQPGYYPPFDFSSARLALDADNAAYVAYSALRPTGGGTIVDPYIAKISSDGDEFLVRTSGTVADIAVDSLHNIYIALTTSVTDLPTTAGAIQDVKLPVVPPGVENRTTDMWLAQLDPTGAGLLAATYLGGSNNDTVTAIALVPDLTGVVILVGATRSDDLPLVKPLQTLPTPSPTIGVDTRSNAFISIVDLKTSPEQPAMKLVFSSYLGGGREEYLSDVVVDDFGNLFVVGGSNSLDFPVKGALQSSWSPGPLFCARGCRIGVDVVAQDLVIAKIDLASGTLDFSTYFGGSGHDFIPYVAVDRGGNIHVAASSSGQIYSAQPTTRIVATADFPDFNRQQEQFGGGEITFFTNLATDAVVLQFAQQGTIEGRGSIAVQGHPFTGVVAEFVSPRASASAGDFTVQISWGDGEESPGVVTNGSVKGQFRVIGTHQYDTANAYPVKVNVTDRTSQEAALTPLRDINISRADQSQTSGAIAIDPTDPSRLAAVMLDERGFINRSQQNGGGILIATSRNGGVSWSPRLLGSGDDGLPAALTSPDVTFDSYGNLFVTYVNAVGTNIVVAWSTDGGATFKPENVREIAAGPIPGAPDDRSLARAKLASGPSGELWLTFELNSEIVAMGLASTGRGQVGEFQPIQTIPGSTGGRFSDIVVAPNGSVVVAWQVPGPSAFDGQRLMSSADLDGLGEASFSLPTTVLISNSKADNSIPAQPNLDVPLGPRLAVVPSDQAFGGRIFLTYTDLEQNDPTTLSVFLTYSDDLGKTWTAPNRVNDHPSGNAQFAPGIAVDPVTGTLAVTWYGTQDTSVAHFVNTSSDGGKSFAPRAIVVEGLSDAVTPTDLSEFSRTLAYGRSPRPAFFNGKLYPIWTDNFSGVAAVNLHPPSFDVLTRILGVITVRSAPPAIRPQGFEVIANQPFHGVVATFTVLDATAMPSDFTARIQWGDGNDSPGVVSQPGGPGTFVITGDHTYSATGVRPVYVTVQDKRNNVVTLPISDVSQQQGSQASPSIAIDPTNANRAFATWLDVASLVPAGIPVSTSNDGGVTWTTRTIADGSDDLPPGSRDARAVFDSFGNLFLTYVTRAPDSQVAVLFSTDGGASFARLRVFADRDASQPSIAVGPVQNGEASVWLTWVQGDSRETVMAAAAPVTGFGLVGGFVEQLVAAPSTLHLQRNFGDIAVGPGGQVMVTYLEEVPLAGTEGPATIFVHLDSDGLGPQPFGAAVKASDTNVGPRFGVPAQPTRTIDPEGSLAWDQSDGPFRGRVYLVYLDSDNVGNSDTNLLLRYSDDNGATWSNRVPISPVSAAAPNGALLPAIAVDQATGNLAVSYTTPAESSGGTTKRVVVLLDAGGQQVGGSYIVSAGESNANDPAITDRGKQFQYGDYSGLSFANGILQTIWTDNSGELLGNPDRPNLEIASARVGVATVIRQPLVVTTFDIQDVEGHKLNQRVATFTDPNGEIAAEDYKATINWGDGSKPDSGTVELQPNGSFAVLGSHEYATLGRYTISVSIKANRTRGEGTATAVIENAPLEITIPANLRVVREQLFTKVVGTITDFNGKSTAADFITTVDWGDGMASLATLQLQPGSGQDGAPNTFNISASHRYLSENTFTIKVSVRDKPAEKTTDQQGSLISGDPPLIVMPGEFLDIEALEGINTGDLLLVKFERADDIEVPLDTSVGEYIATINWGDGQVDTNIIPFVTSEDVTVVGRHTYTSAGEFFPTVTLRDDSGGNFFVPLIALVEPDVTAQVSAAKPGLTFNQITDRYEGDLVITNVSSADIAGPLFVVIHDLPASVTLDSFTDVDGVGNPLLKINQSRLAAGASLPPIALAFSNPNRVPFDYSIQVFDGIRPTPVGGAGLVFEPNLGQVGGVVSYVAIGSNYAIGLAANQATVVLRGDENSAGAAAFMQWVGGNSSPTAIPRDPLPGVTNYLQGDSSITGVPHYGRVRYGSVYDGIDLEYYGREGVLEYDWIVSPGADVSAIRMRFSGLNGMIVDSAGNLRFQTSGGELVQRAPVAYQLINGQRYEVSSQFVLQADGTVTFDVGDYDPSLTLVIDPVLVYSTYFGGSTFGDFPRAVTVDDQGNSYITGSTLSIDFPTVNPFDGDLNDPSVPSLFIDHDAFITKLDPNGVPIFSTFLGGSLGPVGGGTQARAIAVDDDGRVFVGGFTNSPTFPKLNPTPAPFGMFPNNADGFVTFLTELSGDGSAILYSTILGVRFVGDDPLGDIQDMAVDDKGAVYATGQFAAYKLDPVTNTVAYVYRVFGFGLGIAVDDLGQAYITGDTNLSSFPTKNALFPELHNRQADERDNPSDAFVVKLSATGDVLFATYLGGRSGDSGSGIAVDAAGVIYVAGTTQSDDLPVPGGLDTTRGGLQDGFLIKLANDGSSLLYGTYIGGSGDDTVTGVGVDTQGRVYVGGRTTSADLPTVRAHQPALANTPPTPDGFAASISPNGDSFQYLTYLGGGGVDEVIDVAVDRFGNAAFLGSTNSPDFPTRNAWQRRLGGTNLTAFIVRLLPGDAGAIELHNVPFTVVEGNTYNGLVAFFTSNGTETADQFSATIDWGDGVSTAGTIAGDYLNGFQVFGNHFYSDVGTHDVFVTLRDSLGRTVGVTSTGAGMGGAEGRFRYHVGIDTASLVGVAGQLSFQFNPGAIPGSPDIQARVRALNLFGGMIGSSTIDGDAEPTLDGDLILKPSAVLNRLTENITLGAWIEFDVEFTGAGILQPAFGDIADVFAVQLLSVDGVAPLLDADATGSILRVNLSPDGSTQARSASAAVAVAASGRATVNNGPISLSLIPLTIQEGLEFTEDVATFTDGNPLEEAGDFTALIDWGDGSPATTGIVSGGNGNFTVTGTHVYKTVGSYSLVVKVIEPDGLEVSSAAGRNILAAETIRNNWNFAGTTAVSRDFNGDGILDLAVGPYLAVPTGSSEAGVGIFLRRGDGSFELVGFQKTGTTASQLAVADFNNDGNLDVAAAIVSFGGTSVVELLLGNGDGTLQPSVKLTELSSTGNLVTGDFNGDGNADLAFTQAAPSTPNNRSATLQVALGQGDGTFASPTSTTVSFGIHRLFVADIDGDSVPDLVDATANFQGATDLQFYRGLGDGSFAAPLTIASGLPFTSSLAVVDFDGDGNQDIAAAVGTSLNVYRGHGDGTFDTTVQIAEQASVVVAADFNGDGRPDLASINSALMSVSIFLNDTTGGFVAGVRYVGVSNPLGLLTVDFDRDGHIDLAAFGNTTVISVLPGFGDGTFASAVRYPTGLIRVDSSNREVAQGVVTTDVNGDGQTDAVLLFADGPIVTELGNGDGTFQAVVSNGTLAAVNSGNVGLGFGGFRNPVLADFNNDGLLDLVGPAGVGSGIGIVLGDGAGGFPTNHVASAGGAAVVLADFNQDGRLDMAVANNSFTSIGRDVSIYLARPDGTYPDFQNAIHYATGNAARSIVTGDFNGDGRPDLAVANETSRTLSVLLGNADGTFMAAISIPVGTVASPATGIQPQSVRAGDFNGDGKLDLITIGFDGTGRVLPGNGDGTFGAPVTFTTGILNAGRDLAIGDFNRDGKLDIVTASEGHVNFFVSGGGLSVLLGNGDFTFQSAVTYVEGFVTPAVTLGDFNGDGTLDIAAISSNFTPLPRTSPFQIGQDFVSVTSGKVGILFGNADGTFRTAVNYATTGATPRSIAAGDLNADGILDLAVFNNSGDTAILNGNANGTFQPSVNYFTRGDGLLSGPIAIAIGDLNGDGRADVATSSTLLLGSGDGTFPNRQLFTYLPPVNDVAFQTSQPLEVAAGDFNSDGNMDLVVAMQGTTVILFGNGNGSFQTPVRLDPPAVAGISAQSNRVALVDMDGDGDLDLVTLHSSPVGGAVAMWRNDGTGDFSPPVVRLVPFPTYEFASVVTPDLEIGDLNGDGFLDVVVTDTGVRNTDPASSGGVSVMLGIGDGRLGAPVRYLMPPRQSAYGIQIGDLNRDGRPELVLLTSPIGFDNSRSAVAVFANQGDGTFGTARVLDFGGLSAMFLAIGDFNGDGGADIIVPISESNVNQFSIIFTGEGPVLVTDAPVTVTARNLNPNAGLAFTATVATVIDDNPFGVAGDFTATINWGDGQTSAGVVSDNPLGGFQVTGSHTYATGGVFTTRVTVREIGEGTHSSDATARVSAADQTLTATGVAFTATEDLPFRVVVATFTDADANGTSSDFSASIHWGDGQTSSGVIAANDGGGFRVIGSHVYANSGSFAVVVTINDIGGSTATANSTAQVAPHVNRPPVAIDDLYAINEDTTLTVPAAQGVLANDTDADGDMLGAVIVATTTRGSLTLNGNGGFVYRPNANFFGMDSFTYRANDGRVDGNLATVTITVNPVNDAPVALNDTASTDEDTSVVINVLANDTDIEDTIDPTTVAITFQPLHGSLQVNAVTGAVTYTPSANFFGLDRFRYRVRGVGGLTSNIAEVAVIVKPLNDVPVAQKDTYFVNEDSTRSVSAAKGVLANDSDVDGDVLTAVLVANPEHGMLTLNPDGSFTFVPEVNYFGSDRFLYRASDGREQSATATVSLTILSVNDAPVIAALGNVTFAEGTALTRNGSFSDGDAIDAWTATVDYGDGSGVQPLALNGMTFALNHAYADSGNYVVMVKVTDREGAIGSATFEAAVQNLAAIVSAGSDQSVKEGDPVNIAATFADPGTSDTHTAAIDWGDGTAQMPLTVSETAGAGTLAASHVYTDNGVYIVTLTVTDDEGAIGTDTLTITVGNLPPAVNAGADRTIGEGQTLAISASFSDAGTADVHTATFDWGDGTPPQTARVKESLGTGTASASHRYLDNGIYTLTVTVTDDDGGARTDTVVITVENAAPLVDTGLDRNIRQVDSVSLPAAYTLALLDDGFAERTLTRVAGSFVDSGAADTHTATIDWGDGVTESVAVVERQFGPADSPTGVSGVVQAEHRYTANGIYQVTLTVMDKDGGVGVSRVDVTVSDAPPTTLSIAATDADKPEGNSGNTAFTFTVTRSGDVSGSTMVAFTVSGSGTNPADAADFGGALPSGQVMFEAEETTKTITINVSGDSSVEPDEGFTVTLSSASGGATISSASAVGTIRNDDTLPTTVGIFASSADKAEGNAGLTPFTFTVTRGGDVSGMTTVNFAVTGSGANPADATDFGGALPSGQVSFAATETTKTITINVRGDRVIEPDEGFAVTLSGASGGATITSATATGIIRNDDVASGFTMDCSPLHVGLNTCTILGSTPGGVVNLALGIQPGDRFLPTFGVTLGMLDPTIVAQGIVQPNGQAVVQFTIPTESLLRQVLLQAFEHAPIQRTTNIEVASQPLLAFDPRDVNRDGDISPIDAMLVINQLGQTNSLGRASGESPAIGLAQAARIYDVNGDGEVSPIDALLVINYLNRPERANGESEGWMPPEPAVFNDIVESTTPASLDDDTLRLLAAAWHESDACLKKRVAR